MSRTTVKIIENDGQINDIAELGNSWGSAAFVWSALGEKYFNDKYICVTGDSKKMWALVDDNRLSKAERVVLAFTFDYAIIENAHFTEAAKLFREFSEQFGKAGEANHLPAIANLLDAQSNFSNIGMCFQQTSVAEDVWHEWDDESETEKPYDLSGNRHFFVFAEYGDK